MENVIILGNRMDHFYVPFSITHLLLCKETTFHYVNLHFKTKNYFTKFQNYFQPPKKTPHFQAVLHSIFLISDRTAILYMKIESAYHSEHFWFLIHFYITHITFYISHMERIFLYLIWPAKFRYKKSRLFQEPLFYTFC